MSIGKRATSTEVPARPPAMREVRKGVWRSMLVVVAWSVLLVVARLSLVEDAMVDVKF